MGRNAHSGGLIKPGLGHSYLRIFHLRPGTFSSTDHGRTRYIERAFFEEVVSTTRLTDLAAVKGSFWVMERPSAGHAAALHVPT